MTTNEKKPEETENTAEAAITSPTPADIGAQFTRAREAARMSVGDVAQHLKLSPAQVEALEAGEYDKLPGTVFVRGFIRNYARLLGLDASAFLTAVQTRGPQVAKPTPTAPQAGAAPAIANAVPPSADIPFPAKRGIPWHLYAIIIVVLAIPVLIFQFFYRDQPVDDMTVVQSHPVTLPKPEVVAENSAPETVAPAENAPTTATPEEKVATPALPVTQAPEPQKPALQPQKETSSVVEDVVGNEEEDSAEDKPKPDAKSLDAAMSEQMLAHLRTVTMPSSDGTHALTLTFDEDSWTEIYDARGQNIFWQLGQAGTTRHISGIAPLVFVIGNAHSVHLEVDGTPLDITPYAHTDVARFKLQ